jgi:hypothetical protein
MRPRTAIAAAALFIGTGLVAAALFFPLVTFPVVGSLRFNEHAFGGPELFKFHLGETEVKIALLTAIETGLLLLASILSLASNGTRGLSAFLGGGALGLIGGLVWAVYRAGMDRLMELADTMGKDIKTLLDNMQFGAGAYLLAAGAVVWIVGALLARQPAPDPYR